MALEGRASTLLSVVALALSAASIYTSQFAALSLRLTPAETA